MNAEAIEHYLADASRRGPAPDGSATGSAGGAPCGDLIRISLRVDEGLIADVTQDAEGCAASRAAAAAVAELVDGVSVLDAAAIGPRRVEEELGGLAASHLHSAELAADALHRALSACARGGARLSAPPEHGERVLVALSGGVDSAVAALLERERGAEVVAVTLKLWADRATDGERSCCSPEAVLRARRVAHDSLGIPHLTLDLEPEFRAGVVQPFIDGYAAGTTPNPCVLCNGEVRIDAMIALAGRLGASTLVTGHYARIADDGEGPLLSRRRRRGQGPDLHALGTGPRLARAPALPARLAGQAPRAGAGGVGGARGSGPRREPGPLLPRRPGQARVPAPPRGPAGSARSRSSMPTATASVPTAAITTSRSASAGGWACPRPSRSTCWEPTPPSTG